MNNEFIRDHSLSDARLHNRVALIFAGGCIFLLIVLFGALLYGAKLTLIHDPISQPAHQQRRL